MIADRNLGQMMLIYVLLGTIAKRKKDKIQTKCNQWMKTNILWNPVCSPNSQNEN
jgi:hypothetical protein